MASYKVEYWTRIHDNEKDCWTTTIKAISPKHAIKKAQKLRPFIIKIYLTKLNNYEKSTSN